MISKVTALYDWQLEEDAGVTEVNDFAMMVAKKAVTSFVHTSYTDITDDTFLKELLDSLAMSGLANEIAGNSAPTSGSEHLISHALDKLTETPNLHGIQVGIATYLMSLVQDNNTECVRSILTDTGFFEYVGTLKPDKAIDLAPSIKPFRHTCLHIEANRKKAKRLLREDAILQGIFLPGTH